MATGAKEDPTPENASSAASDPGSEDAAEARHLKAPARSVAFDPTLQSDRPMASNATRLVSGTTFGRYRIEECVGRGGMGEVYRAYDHRLERVVALKIVRSATSSSPESEARLMREARSAASIKHPNAVSIHDIGDVDGRLFIAMEYVDGATLREIIAHRSASLHSKIEWIIQIGCALDAAHQQGIIHRDVKPENVIIDQAGRARVLDFGIARRATTHGDAPVTRDGAIVGTPQYMAPEQWRGEVLDGGADQFAWGVLGYELIVGRSPWSESDSDPVAQILTATPVFPASFNGPDERAITKVILRALSKSRTRRYRSIADAVVDLARATGRNPLSIPLNQSAPLSALAEGSSSSVAASNRVPTRTSTNVGLIHALVAPRTPPRPGRRIVTIVAATIALLVLVVAVRRQRNAPHSSQPQPSHDASAALDDTIFWPSTVKAANSTAATKYTEGIQRLKGGAIRTARTTFKKAVEADESMASARLLYVLFAQYADADVREQYRNIEPFKERLTGTERELYEACEDWMGESANTKISGEKLARVWASHPNDVEVGAVVAFRKLMLQEYAGARADAENLLKMDPTLALAWLIEARSYSETDDAALSIESYVKCTQASTDALDCLAELGVIYGLDGRCEEMESVGRRMVAVAPESPYAYQILAAGIFGVTESVDPTRGALLQRWSRLDEGAQKEWLRASDEETLSVLAGDFAGAFSSLARMGEVSATLASEGGNALPLERRMDIEREFGDLNGLRDTAEKILRTQRAYRSGDHLERDIYAQNALYEAGAIGRDVFASRRDDWIRRSKTKAHISEADRWMAAYAEPARSRRDAEEALHEMPSLEPFEGLLARDESSDFSIGQVLQLAGRTSEAAHYFERASRTCSLSYPVHRTWSKYRLGTILEEQNNAEGACAAYRSVVHAWGREKRSVSARASRERMRHLGCAWVP